ncbi:bifunctional nuclease family protein [Sulfodiicoccus acidiphilus]|nr:bifunctional nuclease domain-containing protein [Sulfodiicoccus acidiphilus]
MDPETSRDTIKVDRVEAFFLPVSPSVPVIVCYLEDGRQFNLLNVPVEIVMAINKFKGLTTYNDRETIYEVLLMLSEVIDELEKRIDSVVIDNLNRELGVYSATVSIKFDGVLIQKNMIPSHAIYLALLSKTDIYVKKELVDDQEKEMSNG